MIICCAVRDNYSAIFNFNVLKNAPLAQVTMALFTLRIPSMTSLRYVIAVHGESAVSVKSAHFPLWPIFKVQ